jgi:hypothetical protein
MWGPTPQPVHLPASIPSPLHSEMGPGCSSTCLGQLPAASHMLYQYRACVAALGWGKMVFKARSGEQCSISPGGHLLPSRMRPGPRVFMPQSHRPLHFSRWESAGQMRTGMSWRFEGGLPGSRSGSSSLDPLAALPSRHSCSNTSNYICSSSNSNSRQL